MTAKSTSASKPQTSKPDPEEVLIFCAKCFASSDNASWGGEVMDGHCFNCGAGGCTVNLKRWAIAMIRESASWVGKRYYPCGEDKETYDEVRALRATIQSFPGRSAEEIEPGSWWVKQICKDGTSTMVTVKAKNAREAMYKARLDLPFVPSPKVK